MNKVTYEVKTEKSLKVILSVIAIALMLNALPVIQKMIISDAEAVGSGPIHRVTLCNTKGKCGYTG
ncbi:hypothetical protein N9U23_00445 [Candidatus Pelagibacter sp.]|nr:hypothetical protein [Candidatus Pelagibacter sp.]